MSSRIGPAFADTNYWIALALNRDQYHDRAARWARRLYGPIITTSGVLLEVGNSLSEQPARQECVRLVEYIRSHHRIHVVELTEALFDRGWQLFKDRSDKTWSLVDCISFIVMEDNRLHDALTADRHFEQAGFGALLLDDPS